MPEIIHMQKGQPTLTNLSCASKSSLRPPPPGNSHRPQIVAPHRENMPTVCHACCSPSGPCDVRGVMLHPVREPPGNAGPLPPWMFPRIIIRVRSRISTNIGLSLSIMWGCYPGSFAAGAYGRPGQGVGGGRFGWV
jgi:hypothetical protein